MAHPITQDAGEVSTNGGSDAPSAEWYREQYRHLSAARLATGRERRRADAKLQVALDADRMRGRAREHKKLRRDCMRWAEHYDYWSDVIADLFHDATDNGVRILRDRAERPFLRKPSLQSDSAFDLLSFIR